MSRLKSLVVTLAAALVIVTGSATASRALIIELPDGIDWIIQRSLGFCSQMHGTDNFRTWQQLADAPDQSISLQNNEVICIIGHGSPGGAGTLTAQAIANMVRSKVVKVAENRNPVLLTVCYSATPGPNGPSILQAFEAIGGTWAGNPISGALGPCIDNPDAAPPMLQTVMPAVSPDQGPCNVDTIVDYQDELQAQVQGHIDHCVGQGGGDFVIGQCLSSTTNGQGPAITRDFFVPLLNYVAEHQCAQIPGTVSGQM